MKSRLDLHKAFLNRFHNGRKPKAWTPELLDEVETALNTKLPTSYRQFMMNHGAIYTPTILEEISERSLEHPDIQEFFKAKELISATKMNWSGGMPEDVIGIASDCMGNVIGFRRESVTKDDQPVVFFDHDYVEVNDLDPSFDAFLTWYLDHLKVAGPDDF